MRIIFDKYEIFKAIYYVKFCFNFSRHADVMKKIINTVADGGNELGVHMYPFNTYLTLASMILLLESMQNSESDLNT